MTDISISFSAQMSSNFYHSTEECLLRLCRAKVLRRVFLSFFRHREMGLLHRVRLSLMRRADRIESDCRIEWDNRWDTVGLRS